MIAVVVVMERSFFFFSICKQFDVSKLLVIRLQLYSHEMHIDRNIYDRR